MHASGSANFDLISEELRLGCRTSKLKKLCNRSDARRILGQRPPVGRNLWRFRTAIQSLGLDPDTSQTVTVGQFGPAAAGIRA